MIYDISIPLSEKTEVYPGDRPFVLCKDSSLATGGDFELSSFEMSAHAGTHIDAPCHFCRGGLTIDQIPLDIFFGPAIVIDCQSANQQINADQLSDSLQQPHSRILLKTMAEDKYLTSDAVDLIISSGCKLIGIDQLCLDNPSDSSFPVHHALLSAGVIILECINLNEVPAGRYIYQGAPLNITNAEAAPLRPILISEPK